MRTRARISRHEGVDPCRLDVGRSTRPVVAKTSKATNVFFVRMNNSTRAVPKAEATAYVVEHFAAQA